MDARKTPFICFIYAYTREKRRKVHSDARLNIRTVKQFKRSLLRYTSTTLYKKRLFKTKDES